MKLTDKGLVNCRGPIGFIKCGAFGFRKGRALCSVLAMRSARVFLLFLFGFILFWMMVQFHILYINELKKKLDNIFGW